MIVSPGLRRIGIDEISYRKGQRYLLCVVDHDTGRLVWAGKNRNATTLGAFFDLLGEQRSAQLTHVSADGAEWIHDVVAARAPQAVLCLDAFHVVAWATKALDAVRRGAWNQLRAAGDKAAATSMKNTRWALLRNPPDLTGDQPTTLAIVATVNRPLYRAYLLKLRHEALRHIPSAAGRNSEGGSWIRWLTWIRKMKGTTACQKSNGRAQAYETMRCGIRVIRRKLYCL